MSQVKEAEIVEDGEAPPGQKQELMVVNSLSQISTMIQQKDIDPAKLHSLLDFQERLMKSQAELDFNAALCSIQIDLPRITKGGEIKNKAGQVVAKYIKYDDIDAVLRPMLAKEGFALQHDCKEVNGKMLITTTLRHRGGHKESVSISLPYDQPNALKNSVQCGVSTSSYGKRANVCSLFNIVGEGEDDDAMKSEAVAITEEQAAEIKDKLRETGADVKKFLDYIGADSVDEIPISKYNQAIIALERKAQKGGA